jgi:hypothetical protein
MKKLGSSYTVKGILDEPGSKKIPLFDGRFDTGFVVTDFVIATSNPDDSAEDCWARLSTESNNSSLWDWSDQTSVAWAVSENRVAGSPVFGRTIVDPDNLVIEDLWVYARSITGNDRVNYMITLQKYEFNEWRGTLAMVRNLSQNA